MEKGKLLFIICLLLTIVALGACGDKDDVNKKVNPNEIIVGTWEAVNEFGDVTQFVFYEDGTFIYNIFNKERIDDIFEGTYVTKDETISLFYTIHKERNSDTKWYELAVDDTQEFRFRISDDKLTF